MEKNNDQQKTYNQLNTVVMKPEKETKYEYTDTEFPDHKVRMDGIREFLVDYGIAEDKINGLLNGIGYWHCKQIAIKDSLKSFKQ
jgi:hypothetical protein